MTSSSSVVTSSINISPLQQIALPLCGEIVVFLAKIYR